MVDKTSLGVWTSQPQETANLSIYLCIISLFIFFHPSKMRQQVIQQLMSHSLAQNALFTSLITQNPNPAIYKSLIETAAKGIEQHDAEFLGNVYNKQLDRQILKNRIRQITDDFMSEVMQEIVESKLTKEKEELGDGLDVQLDVREIYDRIDLNVSADRGKEKVKEINEDFKKFKEKMDEIKRFQEMRKAEKAALEEEFKKSLEKEKREEQRQEIRKKIEALKHNNDERKQANEKYKAFFREYKKTKPMHVLMEQEYKEKVELPAIEQNRKKLENLSHKKKPTLEEINNHDRYYIDCKSNRPELIVPSKTIDVSFKSHFYQLQEQKLKEREQFQENGYQWDQIEKQKRYSQFVKDKVRPKVSSKLKEALEQSLVKGYVHFDVPDRSKVIQVGKNYLEFMRSLQKNRRSATPTRPVQQIKESRYINYLQQLKSHSQHSHTTFDWQRDLKDKDTTRQQKRDRILMKSKQLQQKAMRDQKFVVNHNFGRAQQIINKKKEIDDILLSSIKAKVAVLRDSRDP